MNPLIRRSAAYYTRLTGPSRILHVPRRQAFWSIVSKNGLSFQNYICRQSKNPAVSFGRGFANKSPADDAVEKLEELYDNAREEFQIATEETDENTIYAADDRAAAREALDALKSAYSQIVDGAEYPPDMKEEVQRRAGQRIRELENAVEALEEKAIHQD